MKKTLEELWNEFQKELKNNKVAQEEKNQSHIQASKEFAEFIKTNKCKIKGGKKDE